MGWKTKALTGTGTEAQDPDPDPDPDTDIQCDPGDLAGSPQQPKAKCLRERAISVKCATLCK